MSEGGLSADDLELPIKRTTGETLEERLTGNAYHNILPARYLQKDADGDLVEQQEDLFERVAKNIALAEAVFEANNEGLEVTVTPDQLKPDHPRRDELAEEVFGKGVTADDWEAGEEAAGDASGETASDAETTLTQYNVNKFAYETVVPELPDEVREHVEATAAEFREAMEDLSFTPNCVPPDSLVATGGGMKEISDIEPGERVYDDRDGHATVETTYQNGEKLVVEVETDSGYSVRATPEHYFRVIDEHGEYEWRQVKDLEPGHSLALQKNFLDDEGDRPELEPVRRATDGGVATVSSTTGRPRPEIETPDSLTPEFAEWLGLYVGDGTARESGVRVAFDDADEDLVEQWCELTDGVFGFEPTTRQRVDAACVVGQACRRDLYAFLDQNGLLKESSGNASVPAPVLGSGRSPVASFLRGLFEADGTVGERRIELYTHSETLGRQVQKLLLGLGIRSRLSENRDGYRVSIRKTVCGKRFVERVGFISDRKSRHADRFREISANATSITVPNQSGQLLEWYRESDLGHDAYRDLSQFLIDPDSEDHQDIGKEVFERYAETYPELRESPVAEHVERDQVYESVSSITEIGSVPVEDMQVPRRDTYVVEGFVSHNSPTLMNAGDELQQLSACFVDSPEDDIDDIHQTAKEAAQVFQCLTDDARVYVEDEGTVSVADVEPGDRIAQRDGDSHRTRVVEETHAYNDAPVTRVETAAGVEVTGTPNHELLVDGDWTRIDGIEPGNALSLRLGWIGDENVASGLRTVAGGTRWSQTRTVSNDTILELYSEGLSDYEIADRLDSSASTIQCRRSLELGLDPNGTGGRPGGNVSFDETEFERLHDDGLSDGEIAGELGVSTRAVARYRETQSLDANGEAVRTVRQPTEFTPDLAELVGMWVGDGSKHEDGIRLHLNREETLERADRLCRDLFDVGLDWRWEEGCYDAVLHSHEVKRWWLANFGDAKPDATSASVPEQVRAADRETVGAFLSGLFSTGGSLQKDLYPRLRSSSQNLIEEVQQLLIGVDIPATQWEYDVDHREYYNVGPTGERGLDRFLETVGFVDARSETMAERFESVDSEGPAVGTIDGSTWHVPVESVEDAGTATVYDVTVEDDPEYVASSVVSHNSGGGMGYAFWQLRPYGDPVGSTGGIASGPITFMRTYDQMCFTPGTDVLTPGGQRPIESLEEGDLVLDEHGDERPVVEVMERNVDEDLVEITPESLNRQIRATEEHPFRVVRNGDLEWVDACDLNSDDLLVLGHSEETNGLDLAGTVELSEIASGPLVFTDGGITVNREYYGVSKGTEPAAIADEVPVEDFATVAGWYLAEGCVVYRRGVPNEVTFTLHDDERDAVAEIEEALGSFDVSARLEPVENRNAIHVHVESASFAQFVEGLFGTGAGEKAVPELLRTAPVETQARTLEALFDGDGRVERRDKSQRVQLKLANEAVIDFVFQAGLRCGVQFSRHDRTPEDRKPTYSVSASVSTAIGTPLEGLFDDVPEDFVARDRTKQATGRQVVTIDEVDRVPYEGPVHNVEVPETHSYIAEDVVVHNCETIAQGGARRGAQMGVMRVSHPDVVQFIHAKNKDVSLAHTLRLNDPDDYTHTTFAEALEEARELIDDEGKVPKHLRNAVEGHLSNFNISVGITDDFIDAVENDEEYTFTNPRTGDPHVATAETKELYDMFDLGEYVEVGEVLSVPAQEVWERIVEGAHENGEPGVIYLERVNKEHSFDVDEHPDHRILATNPCVTGDTEVVLADGTTETLETLAENGQDVRVLCRDTETDELVVRVGRNPRRTREDADLVRVETEDGASLTCTPDHEVWTPDGYVEAGELTPGETVVGTTAVAVPAGGLSETVSGQLVVSSVSDAGSGPVYNVTVDDHHNYLAVTDGDTYVSVANCGEQPLEEYEACNLGHINLSTLAAEDAPDWRVWSERHGDEYDSFEDAIGAFLAESIDWAAFDRRIELGTRFLENVVTMSDFPVDEIEETVREMRKIGLGIMGLAQLYIQLGMKYGSDTSNEVARQLMRHINHHSKWTSHELAGERGTFGEWEKSKYADPTEYREWFEKQTGLDADDWAEGFPIRNHNSTTIAPTGCVEENSLVSTDEGLRPIKDLDETTAEFEQWGEIEVGVSTDGGTKTATAVYDNGFADVRQIETEGGFGVVATPNHRFRTITADGEYVWKEADEFEASDRIVLQRGTFDGGSRVTLDTSERENCYRNTDDDLELPDRMEPELAEFLGYFMGDGYVHDEVGVKLVVESDAEELDEYLRDLGESVFGVTPTVEDRDTRHILRFGGRHLSRYFADNDWKKDDGNEGEGAASAFVPDEVLQGDEAVAKAFLRGLFEADGTASRKVELSTVSGTLADQVQTLLLALGCVFVRDTPETAETDDHSGDRPRHSVRGANKREDKRFADAVGFITKSTAFDLTPQSYRNDAYPPAAVDVVRDVDSDDDVSGAVKKRVNQSPVNGSVPRKLVRDIERETGETVRLDGRPLADFYVATVADVAEETAYTKDISVPSNNTYVANGFVTHNTTSMVGNTTGGCEPIYNVAYYKNVSDDVQGDEMLVEFDDYFLRVLDENDLDVEAVKREAQEQMAENEFDGVDGLTTVPDAVGELFVTTGDLSAKQHAGIQVACQEGVDSAISKTVNAPNSSTVEDAKEVFEYIYEGGGKGVTYYRDGTRSKQVLTTRAENTDFADMGTEEVVEQIEEVFGGLDEFLEDEAVRAALDEQVEELLAAADGEDSVYAEKKPRPDQLHGVTQRIETGYGKLYVTINEDPQTGDPFELFANTGHSGGFTNSFTDALAKTISVALRSGVDPYEIVDKLQGIRSPKVAWDKGEQINSIPDAFGTALRRYLDDEIDKAYPQQQTLEETADDADDGRGVETPPETDGGSGATADAGTANAGPDAGVVDAGPPGGDAGTTDTQQASIDFGESPECPECGAMSVYYSEGCKTCESCGWSEC